MNKITIQVEGMSCQHCVKAVEGALSALEGVEKAKVNLGAGSVEVEYNQDAISLDTMKSTIEDHGYDVI